MGREYTNTLWSMRELPADPGKDEHRLVRVTKVLGIPQGLLNSPFHRVRSRTCCQTLNGASLRSTDRFCRRT